MKIRTIAATEEPIKTPDSTDLDAIKAAIPHADQFPLPTPAEVASNFQAYLKYYGNFPVSPATVQFITGKKSKGQGVALASYPTLYDRAIIHLQELWKVRDNPQAIAAYLIDHPIYYKKDKNPDDVRYTDEFEYIARCFTNLMEWIYLSSCPAYQYLREQLLEKARYIRKVYSADASTRKVSVLPQRPTTSRTTGENETAIHAVNGGYKFVNSVDPFTGQPCTMLQLVTWFFTDSKTHKYVFTDYFEVDNKNSEAAINKMYHSDLYRGWARKMTPKEYATACNAFRVPDNVADIELNDLILLGGELS